MATKPKNYFILVCRADEGATYTSVYTDSRELLASIFSQGSDVSFRIVKTVEDSKDSKVITEHDLKVAMMGLDKTAPWDATDDKTLEALWKAL